MAAGQLDITIEQGATYRKQLLWRGPSPDDGTTPGTPHDLTGCTAVFQLRPSAGSTTILLSASDTDGGIALGGVDGTIALDLSATLTGALVVRKGRYVLTVAFPSGDVDRVLEGNVTVDRA